MIVLVVRVIFPTLLVVIPLLAVILADPEKYAKPSLYGLVALLVVIALLHSYFVQYKKYLKVKYKKDKFIVESFFQGILHSIKAKTPSFEGIDISKIPYRVNIMATKFNINPFKGRHNFFKKCLFIKYHYNMDGHEDLNVILHPGRGVAGKAYKENSPKIGDTTLMDLPGADDWNLTQAEKALTKEIKSLVSIPIRDDKNKYKVLGVLNVDSTDELHKTPFRNKEFQNELLRTSKAFYDFVV